MNDAIACQIERVPAGGTVRIAPLQWVGILRFKTACRARVWWYARPTYASAEETDIALGTEVHWTAGETDYVVVDGKMFKPKAGVDIDAAIRRKRAEGRVAFRF